MDVACSSHCTGSLLNSPGHPIRPAQAQCNHSVLGEVTFRFVEIRVPGGTRSRQSLRSEWTGRRICLTPIGKNEQKQSYKFAARAQRQGNSDETRAAVLRKLLASPGVHQGPACFDGLSAKLVEQAGFSYAFMSGFAVSAARLGAPDMGLLSYGEVLDQGRLITDAVSIPVVGDGDNGYGNALSVKRTVKGFIQAGFAGILIEDQDSPKSCGHFKDKKVVSSDEAVMRIKAAVDARDESQGDIVIIARSDARQAVSLDEALWRAEQFAKAGADVLFIDALASKEEMAAFCGVAPGTPKMANMLEGGGRTPILTPGELDALGFKLVAYPLSLIGVAMRAMQDALTALKSGRLPPPGDLPSFDEIKEIVDIDKYYKEGERYAVQKQEAPSLSERVNNDASNTTAGKRSRPVETSSNSNGSSSPSRMRETVSEILETPVETITPDIMDEQNDGSRSDQGSSLQAIWSRKLRVKITGSEGTVKLDVSIPAGFLEGLSNTIPGVAGLNLRNLLDESLSKTTGRLESGRTLLDVTDRRGERIQIILE